jgi:hypothetical protein
MPSPRLEGAIATMAARARLYERMAHDRGPWGAVIHTQRPYAGAPQVLMYPVTLTRHVHGDFVILTGYLSYPARGITAIDIWCRGDLVISWPTPQQDGPVRLRIELGVEDAELAA